MFTPITTNLKSLHKSVDLKILTGISWKIISCACFAGINILVRYLSGIKIPVNQALPNLVIMFFQHIIGAAILIPFLFKDRSVIKIICAKNLLLQIIRVIIAIIGMLLWYISLSKMPVTEVVAISFITPILSLIGATLLLKERLTIKKSIAILLSLIGGFLISRPDLAISLKFNQWNAIFPIGAALIFAIDKLITRKILTLQSCPKLTTTYLLLFTAPICFILASLTNSWVNPTIHNFIPLFLLGVLSALAHFSFAKSLATAEISTVMPYGISKIVFSSILSYVFFKEIPQSFTLWIGIIAIAISTILLI